MKTRTRICFCIALLTTGIVSAEVSVRLVTPEKRFLLEEDIPIQIVVSNGTSSSFCLFNDPFKARDRQFFWRVAPLAAMETLFAAKVFRPVHTRAWKTLCNLGETVSSLAPGQERVWDFQGINVLPAGISEHFSESQLYVQVLVGSNTWAYSNTNLVKMSRAWFESGQMKLDSAFLGVGKEVLFKVYEHVLDGEHFLFCRGSRICQVPDQIVPQFSMDTNSAVLTVIFEGTNMPPVRFDVKNQKHLSE